MKKTKIVPDTSVIISGILSDLIEKNEIKEAEIIVPEFVLEELRAQASKGREIGFKGLGEIKKIREMKKKGIEFVKIGRRQTMEEIQLAKYGRIDALIMDVARTEKATLYTADMVQALSAEAEGVSSKYFKPYERRKKTKLDGFLTNETMSVHLKENVVPMAKRGKPGNVKLVKIREEKMSAVELEAIIKEIMEIARYEDDSFIEIGGHAASVIQLGDKRIAITRPPFSDSIEATVVRPTTKLTIDDYKVSEKLRKRLEASAEGVLIAGPPGSGKSTFAASLAEVFEAKGKIVKTMESPRDLQVKPEVTQYTKLKGSFENTADMLLLVRPDYTIFDEVRKTEDFRIFSDMRLAGIGMVGVVHASDPVDAVQRFVGRIELGIIPHIIDTIVYLKDGGIKKTYFLKLVVRTPTGMTEADLARPLVEVRDFEKNELEYEIYTFGEENVIIPIQGKPKSAVEELARRYIVKEMRKYDKRAEVEILGDNKIAVRVDNKIVPRLIGTKGANVKELEQKLGVRIDVSPKVATFGKEVDFDVDETGAYIVFEFPEKMTGNFANIHIDDEYLFSATIGKEGKLRVSKDSEIGKDVMTALMKNTLKVFV